MNRRRSFLVAVVGWLASTAAIAGSAPLLIRPADVVGSPGLAVDVVVSSFRSRGVGQGQMCLRSRGNTGTPLFSALQSIDVRSGLGDAVVSGSSFDPLRQEVAFSFSSPSASINEEAGVLAVVRLTVSAGVPIGLLYDLEINQLTLLDGAGQPIEVDRRRGHLLTEAEDDPDLDLEVDAEDVLAGDDAFFGAETEEPFAIGSGTVVFLYDPAIAAGPLQVSMDQALGSSVFSVDDSVSGVLEVGFTSPDGSLNAALSGWLITVTLPTLPGIPPGSVSPVSFHAPSTKLFDPDGVPIPVQLDGDSIHFEDSNEVFEGDFEEGDPRDWSEEVGGS